MVITPEMFCYRPGTEKDHPMLHQLAITAYSEFERVLSPEHWLTMKRNLEDKSRFADLLEQASSFVCELDDKIVGMAYLVPHGNPTSIFRAEWAYIRMVGVLPECRGLGIAQELTKQCIQFAKTSGETTLALHTSEFQPAARHIYESLGFEIHREFEMYGKRYWIYVLPCPLRPSYPNGEGESGSKSSSGFKFK